MNSTKPKRARGVPQPFKQSTARTQQFKPPIAQAKEAKGVASFNQPIAAPAYRPQAKPNAVQQKSTGALQLKTSPVAAPAYRPQPTQKVLQRRMAGARQPANPRQTEQKRPASPVYRPQPIPTVLQAKTDNRLHPRLIQPSCHASSANAHHHPSRVLPPKQPSPPQRRQSNIRTLPMAEARSASSASVVVIAARATKTTPSAFIGPLNAIQRSSESVAVSPAPVTQVSWDDLVKVGKDHGLVTKDLNDDSQLLGPSKMTYPHFHLWKGGKVAFSIGSNKNLKVGDKATLDLATLRDEPTRVEGESMTGEVYDFISWLFRSAS